MASRSDKKAQKKRARAEKLKNRSIAEAKSKSGEGDSAAKKLGVFQMWLAGALFIAAAAFIIYAYN